MKLKSPRIVRLIPISIIPALVVPAFSCAWAKDAAPQEPSPQSAQQNPKPPAQRGSESSATKPALRIDPKPQVIKLIGGKVMLLGVNAGTYGVWRTPGVVARIQGEYEQNLVEPVKADPSEAGKPAKPAGFRVQDLYITKDPQRVLAVDTIYREDGSVDPTVLSSLDENRTSVVALIGGKSALLVKNRWGQRPILEGTYDSEWIISSKPSPNEAVSEMNAEKFKVVMLCLTRNGEVWSVAPIYRADGSFEAPHAWKGGGTGKDENRTQIVELLGGYSALLLADPKNENPLVKGIYPDDQLHTSPDGILLTERYLTLEGDILSVDTLYGPKDSARFVGARQGDRPIPNSDEVIKLVGNKSAVFTVKKLRLPLSEAKQTVEIIGGWTQ